MSISIPTYLTLLRIFLSIFVVFPLTYLRYGKIKNSYIFLLFLSGLFLTDFFDGYIARKFNQESELGRHLDPIADKVSFLSCALPLILNHIIPLPLLFSLLLRDTLVSSLRQISSKKEIISPSWMAKIKSALLMLLCLLSYTSFNFYTSKLVQSLWYIATLLSWHSAIVYLFALF
jgi:CDP-diacylglycerol--glycerol-3-phosphate 3-phosphatidyltransferase